MNENTKNNLIRFLDENHKSNPLLFAVISGILASIGLSTNSYSTIIGSMLLSPIGNIINKKNIYDILNEAKVPLKQKYKSWIPTLLLVIVIVILIGYITGTIVSHFKNPFTKKPLHKDWPTKEMKERANPMNAIYLIFIALTCAIALPMTILTNNNVRFVAIGIATALIPPLANVGLSLSFNPKTIKHKKYKKYAIYTGIFIFLINFIIMWLPSKYLLRIFIKEANVFRTMETIF